MSRSPRAPSGAVLSFFRFPAVLLALTLGLQPGLATADAVGLSVTVDGRTVSNSFQSVKDAFGIIDDQAVGDYFRTYVPGYTDSSAATARISYLDVNVNYGFAAGSNTVTLNIPEIGFTRSFTADNRQNANRQLRDFLRDNGDFVLQEMEKYRVRNSPSSPVAGNPSSLQSLIIDQSFGNLTSEAAVTVGADGKSAGTTQIGFEAGNFSTGRLNGSNYTLPLSYSFELGGKGRELRLSMPLTYTVLDGSKVYSGSFGASYRVPLGEQFNLQSGFTYGVVYSEDLLQLVQLASATLGLSHRLQLEGGAAVTTGVLVGQVKSVPLSIGNYSFDPRIESYPVKIGQIVESDESFFGRPFRVQAFAAYTHLLGQKFFVQNYADFGVNLGLLAPAGNAFTRRLRGGVIFTTADHYSAAKLNLGYAF